MVKSSLPESRYVMLLVLFLTVAALLRAWYIAEVIQAPDFESLRQDMSVQDYQARALLSGDWTVPEGRSDPNISATPYYRPPGYTHLLATLYFFSGGSYLFPRIFNVLIGLAAIVLMARLARLLFGNAAALLTAVFMATYWGFIYYEGEVNDPAVFVFLLPCLFLALRQWGITHAARWAALVGLITGAYALMRPNILLFGPMMAAWMLFIGWRMKAYMRILRAWLALAAMTALVIAPVTMRNYVVSGELVPISTYFGQNLHIGYSEHADGFTSWTPYLQQLEGTGQFSVWEYDHMVQGLGREVGDEALAHSRASTIFAGKALEWIRNNKMAALRLTVRKAVLFWSPREITENKVVHYEKAHYAPLKYLPGFPYVFALFWGGIILVVYDWWRRRLPASPFNRSAVSTSDMLLLICGWLLVYYISFLPFFVNARARHPMVGFFFLFGAYGVCRVAQTWHEKGLKKALPLAMLFVLLFGVAHIEPYPYEPDRARWHYARADSWLRVNETDHAAEEAELMLNQDYSYYMPFRLGHAFIREGRHLLGARLLEAALSPTPDAQPEAYRQDLYFHIGTALEAAGRNDAAEEAFREALRLNPRDARAHNDLGVLLEARNDLDGAREHYRAAIEAQPEFALAYSNLGDLRGRLGDHEGAVQAFERAVGIKPEVADYHYNLAVHLAAAGETRIAIVRYQTVLDMTPQDVRALNNLALLLAETERYSEAETYFKQALALRPEYGLARINLGNLYIEQGQFEQGEALFLEGLQLMPHSAELHNALGYHYAAHGHEEKGREHLEMALQLAPEYDRARINLLQLYLRTGALEKALDQIKHLHTRYPEDIMLLLELGNTYRRLGQQEDAVAAYCQVLTLNPEHTAARTQIEALTEPDNPAPDCLQ